MESLPTQLAIPGQYTPLHRNMVAPSLRAQLKNYNKILHTHKNALGLNMFRDDEFTSKIGGLPSWLPPSPLPDSDSKVSATSSTAKSTAQHFTQPIPSCLGCKAKMMLVSQVFSPIDFIQNLSNFDSNTPVLSCYTGSVVKKCANALNLNSSAPDTVIEVMRHARTLYVFTCSQGLCAYNPGAWKTVSLVQSVPKKILYGPTGAVLFKKGVAVAAASKAPTDGVDEVDTSEMVDDDDEEEEDEDDEEEDYASYPEDDLDCIDEGGAAPALPTLDIAPAAASQPAKPTTAILTTKTASKSQDTFAVAGWSDDEDNTTPPVAVSESKQSSTVAAAQSDSLFSMGGFSDSDDEGDAGKSTGGLDLASLQAMVAQTQALQKKTGGKSEKQIKEDLAKAKLAKKRKKQGIKAHIPVVVEPRVTAQDPSQMVSYRNYDNEDELVSRATSDEVIFFRPFYLWWQGEDASTAAGRSKDFSKEDQLLKQYYVQKDQDAAEGDDGDQPNPDGLLDNEDEDDQDEDPYEHYQETVNNQPEQVIRYFNSNLSLHAQPSAENVEKFRKSSKQHNMQKFVHQSGVWLLHDVPPCKTCQEPLTLECQILPTLLSELRPDEFELMYHRARFAPAEPGVKLASTGPEDAQEARKKSAREAHTLEKKFDLDWGLVNVYSCLNMCSPDEYIPGYCLVQPGI